MDQINRELAAMPDETALARLCAAFPRPRQPMGEAWFMSDKRREFPELCGKLDDVETALLEEALVEIASGTPCFGARAEWHEWFHYLVPRLAPRAARGPVTKLSELLVTAFASQHPLGIEELYRGFHHDVLATLGRTSLRPEGKVSYPTLYDLWTGKLSALSAGLTFHCKYASGEDVERLVAVLLSTQDPFRRAERLAWLVGAHGLLSGSRRSPSDPPEDGDPAVDWEWSHCLAMERLCPVHEAESFIPSENGDRVVAKARSLLAGDGLLAWVAPIEAVPELRDVSLRLTERAFELYGLGEPAG